MRKFYSLALLMVASVFCSTAYGYTGKEDITSSKLTNADFSAMTPVTTLVRTYAKDMLDNGAGSDGAELYGMQPVNGWTASNPTDNIKHTDADDRDAKAAGIFPVYDKDAIDEIEDPIGLGGAYYGIGDAGKTALGIVAVWSATAVYSQDVTLPAGSYILVTTLYNAAGTGTITNKIGFVSESKSFYSEKTTYEVGVWEKDTVYIELDAETAGQITLGFSHSGGSGSAPHIFIDNVKIYTVDAAEAEAQKIAEAKAQLLDLINIGKVYNVDTTASEAVYNNASATLAEVEAAIEAQTKINDSGITDLSAYFIVNSHFDLDEPLEGGICTYDYDCAKNNIPLTNYSMLPVAGWDRTKTDNGAASGVYAIGSGAFLGGADYKVPDVMSDGSSEGKVLGFVTCWSMSMQYKQAVTLPAGDYTLTMSYYNTGGTTAIAKNLIGFVADDGTEYLSDNLTFPVGTWTKDEIKFTLKEETTGYFSLGYTSTNTGSGNMPHFFTDGISLVYVGSGIDPSMFALKAAVSGANKILGGGERFYAEIETNLAAAVDVAQALIDKESADTDANQAAYEALSALVSDANASIAAYKKLNEFMNEGGDFAIAREKYSSEAGYTNTSAALDEIGDAAELALMDYNLDTDKINEIIASLDDAVKTGLQADWDALVESGKSLENGLDITALLENIGENGNFSGWTTTNGNFGTGYNAAEVYFGAASDTPVSFSSTQTLTDMPNGKYTVITKAFFREGSATDNHDKYETESLTGNYYILAGTSKTDMANISAIASEDASVFEGTTAEAATGLYVPNNMQAASSAFDNIEFAGILQRSASTVVVADGKLTFGIGGDMDEMPASTWIIWDGFSILFNGPASVEDLQNDLAGRITALNEANEALNTYAGDYEDDITSPVAGAVSDVYNAATLVIDDVEGVVDSDDEAVLVQAINKVNAEIEKIEAAKKAAEENVAAVIACLDAAIALDEFMNSDEYVSLTPSPAAVAKAEELLAESADLSNLETEEVVALTEALTEVIPLLQALPVPEGYETASDENPFDMTAVIVNNSFEGDGEGSTKGWIWNTKATGDTGVKSATTDPYTVSNADGDYLFNTWNGSAIDGGFYVYQTLYDLPAGTYELKALLASDNNNVITLSANETASDFTITTDETVMFEGSVIFKLEEDGNVEIKASSDTWFKTDYFRLTYFGTESSNIPTSVDGIDAPEAAAVVAIYSVSGAPAAELQKGLNIVKYADGSIKKIFVK